MTDRQFIATRKIAWLRLMRGPGATDAVGALRRCVLDLADRHPVRVSAVMAFDGDPSAPVQLYLSAACGSAIDADATLIALQEELGWFALDAGSAVDQLAAHGAGLPAITTLVPGPTDGSLLIPHAAMPTPQDLVGFAERFARTGVPLQIAVEATTLGHDEALGLLPALRTARAVADALAPQRADVARPIDVLASPAALDGGDPSRLLDDVGRHLFRLRVTIRSADALSFRTLDAVRTALEAGGLRLVRENPEEAAVGAGVVHATNLPALWQIPRATGPSPCLRVEDLPLLPPPVGALEHGVLFAEADVGATVRPLRLDPSELARHAYVVGKTGTGKTTLLETLVASAIERDDQAVIVIDPHGDMTTRLLRWLPPEHARRTLYVDFGDPDQLPSLNLLEADTEQEREFAIGELDSLFLDMYGPEIWGPRIQDTFRNFASLLSLDPEGPGALIDLLWAVNLGNETVRDRMTQIARSSGSISHRLFLDQIQQRRMGDGSLQELVAYYRSKFSPFVDNRTLRLVLGHPRSTLDIAGFIRQRRVCLFNLNKGRISSRYAALIGRLLATRVFQAALANGRLPAADRPPALLVLDEFQNLVSPTIEDILAEARKYRLSLVLANQHLAQVRRSRTDVRGDRSTMLDAILGNVGTLVSFRVSGSDANMLSPELGRQVPPETLASLPTWHAVCQVSDGSRSVPPFLARTRPIGASADGRVEKAVRRRSIRALCLQGEQSERSIRARVMARMGQFDVPDDPVQAMMRSL